MQQIPGAHATRDTILGSGNLTLGLTAEAVVSVGHGAIFAGHGIRHGHHTLPMTMQLVIIMQRPTLVKNTSLMRWLAALWRTHFVT